MPSVPFWRDDPAAWDEAQIGGKKLPGRARVTVKGGGYEIDVKKAKGANGATETFNGFMPREITIELLVWTEEQWSNLQQLMPTIEPKPGKKDPEALDIVHPTAKVRNVKSICVKNIDGPEDGQVSNTKTLTINAIEFLPQPKKKTSATKTAKGSKLSPIDQVQTTQFTLSQLLPDRPSIDQGGPN